MRSRSFPQTARQPGSMSFLSEQSVNLQNKLQNPACANFQIRPGNCTQLHRFLHPFRITICHFQIIPRQDFLIVLPTSPPIRHYDAGIPPLFPQDAVYPRTNSPQDAVKSYSLFRATPPLIRLISAHKLAQGRASFTKFQRFQVQLPAGALDNRESLFAVVSLLIAGKCLNRGGNVLGLDSISTIAAANFLLVQQRVLPRK